MRVTASAPGKLVLMGDHAVVYDRPCLVTAVDIRYRVTVERIASSEIVIDTPDLRTRGELRHLALNDLGSLAERETVFVEEAIAQVCSAYDIQFGLRINTDGPAISYGLGSSSAITVATVAALLELIGVDATAQEIFDLAYGAVLAVQQGRGSGVDLAAAVVGGTVYYLKGGKTLEMVPISEPLPLVIGYSGEKVGTTGLIGQVAQLHERQPALIDGIFDLMGDAVDATRQAILAGDWATLGDLVNIHQGLLDSLNVNSTQLATLIFAARDAGALGAKFSGAGGGDCMFAVVEPGTRENVEAAIRRHGTLVEIKTGVPGVRIESAG